MNSGKNTNEYPQTAETFAVSGYGQKCLMRRQIRSLKKRLRALERRQRSSYFTHRVWQRTVDNLTMEVFKNDPGKMLAFGAKIAQYTDELREIMGIDTSEDGGWTTGEEEEKDV